MRVAFMGTDHLAAVALEEIAKSRHEVVLVITTPDRPKGRGQVVVRGEVALLAEAYRIPVLQPETVKEPSVSEVLSVIKPDIIVVVSYGEYIPRSIYESPPYKSINLHPSLLPRWRGAAPVRYALMAGDEETGVTVQYVHKKMDAGDILMQKAVKIDPDDNHGTLCDKLYPIGAGLLLDVLDGLESGTINPTPQDETKVTKAFKIGKSDLWLDWSEPADRIRNRIRALAPTPGAKTIFRGKDFKILVALISKEPLTGTCEPGMIAGISGFGPVVCCGRESLILTSLQPSGKNPQSGRDFLNGYKPEVGERFEGMKEPEIRN